MLETIAYVWLPEPSYTDSTQIGAKSWSAS